MQQPRIELLPRSYDLPPRNLPRQPACPAPALHIRSVGCSVEASMVPLSCRLSPATATFGRNRSFSSQQCLSSSPPAQGSSLRSSRHRPAQIKAYSACRRIHRARELAEILPSTRNATAQPGRSQPRRYVSVRPLARSYRMKGMPRASLHCRSHRGSIAVRIVMVRRREEGGELSSCSYLGQCDAI